MFAFRASAVPAAPADRIFPALAHAAAVMACHVLVAWPHRAGAQATQKPAPKAASAPVLLLDVSLDGVPLGRHELLERNGVLFAKPSQFDAWRLARRSDATGVDHELQRWYSLASVRGLEAAHYFRESRLELKGGNRLSAAPQGATAPPPAPATPTPPATTAMATPRPPSPSSPAVPTATLAVAAAPAPASPPAGAPRLVPLDVTINGAREGNWVLLEMNGVLHAPADAFDEWRVQRKPGVAPVMHRGQAWYPLTAVPGFEAQLNAANQSVELRFLAGAFGATRITQAPAERLEATAPLTSVFANYDFNQTFSTTRGLERRRDLGALFEVGTSGAFGVLTSTHVGRNLFAAGAGAPAEWRRLETTFTRDFPAHNLTFRAGDSVTRAGAWGRANYFGGLQLARNFALSPGFITQPIPTITGQSSAPSTVELYINDALRQTSQVPTGPFAIDNFPLLTGSGQARVVVRDLLGRETVLVQNFFSHSDLLDEGLTDWSLDAGAVRRNLGSDNSNYGQKFGSAMYRRGLTRGATLEARAEAGSRARGAGLGFTLALPGQLLGQVAVAGSRDERAGSGRQWLAGVEHVSLRHGFTFRAEGADRAYRHFGQDQDVLPYRRQYSASYTFSSDAAGHLGLGYARLDSFDRGPLTTYSANYSFRVGRGSVSLSATRVSGQLAADSFGLSVLIPLANQVAANATVTTREGKTDAYVSASKPIGVEQGAGWRALAGVLADAGHVEGGYYHQGGRGLLTADASASRRQNTLRLGWQGGLVFADSRLFLSRRVQDSFALVEVPGYANVGVGFQSTVITRTDAEGRALVPRLLPYRRNSIRLDPSELPINAEIDSIEQVVVPAARVGVKVAFPVRDGRGALVKIVLEDGDVAPAGAEVRIEGDSKEFFVARRGEAFITGLKPSNVIVLNHNGAQCRITLNLPAGDREEIARLGPVTCRGVAR